MELGSTRSVRHQSLDNWLRYSILLFECHYTLCSFLSLMKAEQKWLEGNLSWKAEGRIGAAFEKKLQQLS